MFDFSKIPRVAFAVGRNGPSGVELLGTAFLLTKPGFFATAAHVVGSDDKNLVLAAKRVENLNDFQDTSDSAVQVFPAKLSAPDPFHDIAVLRADVPLVSNISIDGIDNSSVGTPVPFSAIHMPTTVGWC